MPKDKVEEFRISECGEELALALLFIIEKGLKDEYTEWAKRAKEELFGEKKGGDCYCPFAKEHCANGRVESRPNDECEFWSPKGDCRIRLVLELAEKRLE